MIGYQVYAKYCKKNTKIDGVQNKAFEDESGDIEKNYLDETKHRNKYAKAWHYLLIKNHKNMPWFFLFWNLKNLWKVLIHY